MGYTWLYVINGYSYTWVCYPFVDSKDFKVLKRIPINQLVG